MVRNPTPSLISLFTAFLVGLFSGIVDFLLTRKINIAFFSFSLTAIASFLLFYYALEIFIYRKIKLIYKTIHDFKRGKKDTYLKMIDLDADPIYEVNNEVIEWMQRNNQEIEEMRRVEEFRKEFVGNVSHELKTPLFNLQGYLHTLLDGALEDEKVNRNFLQKAAKSADRMNDLVADLISLTQIETGKLKMEIERFDVHALSLEVFEQLREMATEHGVTLKIKDGCDDAFWVYADPDRIRQVMVNLITNGIKYGNNLISLGFYDMDPNILIEVSDNGEGIDKEHLPRLFERFYRVDKSRSRDAGGTGLGLSIVKYIVDAHNQTINVRSTIGKGTTFGFTLSKNEPLYV